MVWSTAGSRAESIWFGGRGVSGQLLVVGLSPSGLVVRGVSGQLLVVGLSPSGLVVGECPVNCW